MTMRIRSDYFGTTKSGEAVTCYTLEAEDGFCLKVMDRGATVLSVLTPDEDGELRDVLLGYDDLAGYEGGSSWIGATVGRYANRIVNAEFELNGKHYQLEKNNGNNHLHGNFSEAVWKSSIQDDCVVMTHTSPDGEEGFPGTMKVKATFRIGEDHSYSVVYEAESDADTVVNLISHAYFNLNGADGSTVLDHVLMIPAETFTEGDENIAPTGRILPVEGTPLDFRTGKRIGKDIFDDYASLRYAKGYDHNYCLKGGQTPLQGGLTPFCAECYSEESGIRLRVFTTQPGVQLYTANHLGKDLAAIGKNGKKLIDYGAFCLETQHYPSSPTFPQFPSTVLKAGEKFREETVYVFDRI